MTKLLGLVLATSILALQAPAHAQSVLSADEEITMQTLPFETLLFSNGDKIETFIDRDKASIFGMLPDGTKLFGKELEAFRKKNALLSESYTSTRSVQGIDCNGCLVETILFYEGENRVKLETRLNGVLTKKIEYGTDTLAGVVVREWTIEQTKTFHYDLDGKGKIFAFDVTYDSQANGLFKTERYTQDATGRWSDVSSPTVRPPETSSETEKKNYSTQMNNPQSDPIGCDSQGCWTTGTSSGCPSGWACFGYIEMGGYAFIDYQYEQGPEVSFLDSVEGSGVDEPDVPGCIVQPVSGGNLGGGVWMVYGDNFVPAQASIHFQMWSTLPFQINSSQVLVTMGTTGGSGGYGTIGDYQVQSFYDRTTNIEAPVVDSQTGQSFIRIETEDTNVQYPEHVVTVREPC